MGVFQLWYLTQCSRICKDNTVNKGRIHFSFCGSVSVCWTTHGLISMLTCGQELLYFLPFFNMKFEKIIKNWQKMKKNLVLANGCPNYLRILSNEAGKFGLIVVAGIYPQRCPIINVLKRLFL